jgi:hypothetical protein
LGEADEDVMQISFYKLLQYYLSQVLTQDNVLLPIAHLEPRFCSWLQNLPGGLKNTEGTVSIFRVNFDQNAMHFVSNAGKFRYCKIWVEGDKYVST